MRHQEVGECVRLVDLNPMAGIVDTFVAPFTIDERSGPLDEVFDQVIVERPQIPRTECENRGNSRLGLSRVAGRELARYQLRADTDRARL